ncbi:MAG: rhodanese-like domain-containing protein [Bacteroidia bacterium]
MKSIFYIVLLSVSTSFISCKNQTKSGDTKTINSSISVDDFEKKLTTSEVQLVDVRTPEEFSEGHLKGTVNYNVNDAEFNKKIAMLNKNKPVLVYCLSGGRSGSAANLMAENGFVEVYNMKGGIMKWNAANKPMDNGTVVPASHGMSEKDFNTLLNDDKYVLVDYNAKWCKPCLKMAPMLDRFVDKQKEKVILVKIDADANKSLLQQKRIEAIPVLELYKDGKLIWKHDGEIDEETLVNEIKF